MPLKVSDFRGVKAAAEAGVEVPQSVVDLIVDLRRYVFPNPNPNTVWPDYSH
jgi:hypothetical protein